MCEGQLVGISWATLDKIGGGTRPKAQRSAAMRGCNREGFFRDSELGVLRVRNPTSPALWFLHPSLRRGGTDPSHVTGQASI